jgi:hypothetical protein
VVDVSTELAALPDYSAEIERASDPANYVLQACERAKTWLAHALEHGGIEQIVELKCQAEAIRIYTMSKQLGKDAELSAAEIVRRAERGIGLAIRKGQELGEIKKRGERDQSVNQHSRVAAQGVNGCSKPTPTDFASADELHGNGAGIYHMTDDVTDDHFNASIDEGKAEGNLSRANVVRKVRAKRDAEDAKKAAMSDDDSERVPDPSDRSGEASVRRREIIREMAAAGYTSRQISDRIGTRDDRVRQIAREMATPIHADEALGRNHRRIDSNRIVRETVHALEGLVMGVELVTIDDLDPSEIKGWAVSLTDSIRVLNRLVKQMKEKTQ